MSFDITDREALRRWAVGLRVTVDDSDALVEDMLRPPRERELGPATHRHDYRAAHRTIVGAIDAFIKAIEQSGGGEGGDGAEVLQ